MIKAVIAGCGGIAHVHAAVLDAMEDVELAAFCDIIPARALEFADRLGGHVYTDIVEMLESEKPDVLHICLPHYLHVPTALQALEMGVNVFMEKPPVINEEQYEMLKAYESSDSKAKLGFCFQNRYNPCSVRAKNLIESGEAGKVLAVRGFVTWNRQAPYYTESGWRGKLATEGGGVLINQTVHTMDLMTWITGHPVHVSASMANHHLQNIIEVEDTMEAQIRYAQGAVGIFFATSGFSADCAPIIEFICENMTIRMEDPSLTIRYPDGRVEVPELPKLKAIGKGYWGSGHGACIRDYYDSLEKQEHFAVSLSDIKDTTDLLLAMYRSARTNTDAAIE